MLEPYTDKNFMQLLNKTQTQLDIETLESRVFQTLLSLKAAAAQLNNAYDSVWSLSDERLQALMQTLVDAGKFEEIFTLHAQSANYINTILVGAGETPIAKTGAGREYTISENGVVSIIPIPATPSQSSITE